MNINAVTKTWICNTNADDRSNWVGGDYAKGCTGFRFPEELGNICLMSLRNITTSAIYLPETADIVLRKNTEITLSEDSDNCVKVRDDIKTRSFYDWQCWKNDNDAVPDAERAPCFKDDVVFPEDATYSVEMLLYASPYRTVEVRKERTNAISLFWMQYRTVRDCREFIHNDYPQRFDKNSGMCQGPRFELNCPVEGWQHTQCSNPIAVTGRCSLFCGSTLYITTQRDVSINPYLDALIRKQKADMYYSVIRENDKEHVYQLAITDHGNFTGDSISIGRDFYDRLVSNQAEWSILSVTAKYSGPPLGPTRFQNTMTILLATLMAVILLFGAMFLFYVGPLENVRIPIRIPLRVPHRSVARPFLFARFENKEEGTMSAAASVVSLDKAFDNPMYDQQMASTSGRVTMEAVEEGEELKETNLVTESRFSNPIFNEEKIVIDEISD